MGIIKKTIAGVASHFILGMDSRILGTNPSSLIANDDAIGSKRLVAITVTKLALITLLGIGLAYTLGCPKYLNSLKLSSLATFINNHTLACTIASRGALLVTAGLLGLYVTKGIYDYRRRSKAWSEPNFEEIKTDHRFVAFCLSHLFLPYKGEALGKNKVAKHSSLVVIEFAKVLLFLGVSVGLLYLTDRVLPYNQMNGIHDAVKKGILFGLSASAMMTGGIYLTKAVYDHQAVIKSKELNKNNSGFSQSPFDDD